MALRGGGASKDSKSKVICSGLTRGLSAVVEVEAGDEGAALEMGGGGGGGWSPADRLGGPRLLENIRAPSRYTGYAACGMVEMMPADAAAAAAGVASAAKGWNALQNDARPSHSTPAPFNETLTRILRSAGPGCRSAPGRLVALMRLRFLSDASPRVPSHPHLSTNLHPECGLLLTMLALLSRHSLFVVVVVVY